MNHVGTAASAVQAERSPAALARLWLEDPRASRIIIASASQPTGERMPQKCLVHKLEYNVAYHCNLRCDHCDHLSPFFSPREGEFNSSISLEDFEKQIAILSRHVHGEEFLLL